MIRSSVLVLLVAAAGPAPAQQAWHGPTPPAEVSVTGADLQLGRAIALKYASPEYAAKRAYSRLPLDSHSVPGEQAVRQARDKIALARRPPAGASVLIIPRAGEAPKVDGVVGDSEWRGALRLALEPAERKASVLLYVHGGQLYLAALAPGDRTAEGFDQFRFWYHLDLSPFMTDERAMLATRGSPKTLRGTRLPRDGQIREALDPKSLAADADWGVSAKLRGASTLSGFRQYEVSVDLADAGIAPGVAFPAYLEIEGDPILDAAGKYKARFNEGQIGSVGQPLWLRVAP